LGPLPLWRRSLSLGFVGCFLNERNECPSASKNSPAIGVKLGFGSEVRLLSQFHISFILFTPSSRLKMSFFLSSFFLRWQIPNLVSGLSTVVSSDSELRPSRPRMDILHLKHHELFLWSSCSGTVRQKHCILSFFSQSWALFACLGGTHPKV